MDMNARARMYLSAFFTNSEFPGGLAFRTALNQCQLDGTMDSLDRVDQLLDQIRVKLKPAFNSFLDSPQDQLSAEANARNAPRAGFQ